MTSEVRTLVFHFMQLCPRQSVAEVDILKHVCSEDGFVFGCVVFLSMFVLFPSLPFNVS